MLLYFIAVGGEHVIKVRVPATAANIGPGFDCLGVALNIYNDIEVEECNEGLSINISGERCGDVPVDETNLVYRSMKKVFDVAGFSPKGIRLNQKNGIPITRGLGSSAACIVGGMTAANALAGFPFDKNELMKMAVEADGHPDNVVPAMMGGMTAACMEDGEVLYVKIQPPEGIKFAVMIPDVMVKTAKARMIIPRTIPLEDAVFNIGRTAVLVASFLTGSTDNLMTATQDRIHQPYRKALIPHWDEVYSYSRELGAKGVFLSGSGPTIIAILDKGYSHFVQQMKVFVSSFEEHWEVRIADFCHHGAVTC